MTKGHELSSSSSGESYHDENTGKKQSHHFQKGLVTDKGNGSGSESSSKKSDKSKSSTFDDRKQKYAKFTYSNVEKITEASQPTTKKYK